MRKRCALQTVKRPDLGAIPPYAGPMRFEGSKPIEYARQGVWRGRRRSSDRVLGETKAEIEVSRHTGAV
jgi:hypothetical protein